MGQSPGRVPIGFQVKDDCSPNEGGTYEETQD